MDFAYPPSSVGVCKCDVLHSLLDVHPSDSSSGAPRRRIVCAGGGAPAPAFIPGSIYVDVKKLETGVYDDDGRVVLGPNSGNLLPPDALRRAVETMGITAATEVYVYAREYPDASASSDPIAATRLIWALAHCGVRRVFLVDGGATEWARLGYELVDRAEARPPRCDFFGGGGGGDGGAFPGRPDLVATTAQVERVVGVALGKRKGWHGESKGEGKGDREEEEEGAEEVMHRTIPDGILADVRSRDEFVGKRHDYDYFDTLGRIPGARWAHWGPSTYVGGDFVDARGCLRPMREIEELWRRSGITQAAAEQPAGIIFYCGSGWRSSFAWFLATLIFGPEGKVANYDGGWLEWSTCHERAGKLPRVTGEPDESMGREGGDVGKPLGDTDSGQCTNAPPAAAVGSIGHGVDGAGKSVVIGITGCSRCGKGWVSKELLRAIEAQGKKATIVEQDEFWVQACQVKVDGQMRTSEEEPECTNHGKFAAAIKEKTHTTHDVVIAEGFQLVHDTRVTNLLDDIFLIELGQFEARLRRTQPRDATANPNPLSTRDFDDLLWPAHERYLANTIAPLGDRVVKVRGPMSTSQRDEIVQRIMQAVRTVR